MAPTPPPPSPPTDPPAPPSPPLPPVSPVAEPTSKQTAKEIAGDWILAATIAFLLALAMGLMYVCCRRVRKRWNSVPVKVDCPNEPPRYRTRDHELWRRRCEAKKREASRGISLAFDETQVDTVQSLLNQK